MEDSVISMKKFIELLKKYKWFSITILILLITLVILYVISIRNQNKQEPGYSSKMEKIDSPYPNWNEELNITSEIQKIDIPSKDKILTVTGFNTKAFSLYIQDVYNSNEEVNFLEDVYLQFNNKDIITFASNTGILSISSERGVPLKSKINSQKDIKKFLTQYFGIDEVQFEEDIKSNGVIEYKGSYILKEVEIGSSYLNGNSFIIEVNNSGEMVKASILLLKDSNVIKYQYLPIVDVGQLISETNYPKKIGESVIEDRFYNKPSPYTITDYIVKEVTLRHIFNDFESRYIVPTYILDGDAQIKDSYKERYWSKTRIFICAVDPSYLYTREPQLEEQNKEKEGVPFVK